MNNEIWRNLLLAFCLMSIIVGCNGKQSVEFSPQSPQKVFPVSDFVNFSNFPKAYIGGIKNTYTEFTKKHKQNLNFGDVALYDFDNAEMMCTSEAVQLIIIEKINNSETTNDALFGFLKQGSFIPYFVLNKIKRIGDKFYVVEITKITGETIFKYTVKNNNLLFNESQYISPISSSNQTGGYTIERKSAFGKCVSGWFNFFAGGSTEGAIAGLGCAAFGAYCAAAITGNCLAKEVLSWF